MASIEDHSQIQSQVAEFKPILQNVNQSLKPFRPPTAPDSDVAMQRKAILESSAPNFLVVQIALAALVLALVGYLLLPVNLAHPIAALLFSVGIAVGIFLKK
jgi:hypothetical protein